MLILTKKDAARKGTSRAAEWRKFQLHRSIQLGDMGCGKRFDRNHGVSSFGPEFDLAKKDAVGKDI